MAERRKLTPSEIECARAFARALDESGYIPESLASALGVTPGAVGHWYRGEITIPLRRVARVASVLGVEPAQISAEWREAVAPFIRSDVLAPREVALLEAFRNAGEADKDSIERIIRAMAISPPETVRKAS